MKRKVLDYLNPPRTYEYSWIAQSRMNYKKQQRYHDERSHVEERQHYYSHRRHKEEYSSNAQPRMNSKKQRLYHKKRSHVEEQQHYYPHKRRKEGNERSHVEERQHYHPHKRQREGNERSHVEERQHYYPNKRHKEGNERSHVEERQLYYPHRRHEEDVDYDPYGVNFDRGHDHSQCLLIRKQRKERRPDIYPHLFVTEEERALMPIPSPSNKREVDNDNLLEFDDFQPLLNRDDFPVIDYDDQFKESLQKLADFWGKAFEKARQRESAKGIGILDLDYQF